MLAFVALLSVTPDGFAVNSQPDFTVKPPDVALPDGITPGQYRRTIYPFPNWTLICDENFARKQKICNVLQTILDAGGTAVFSWSLAATRGGQPYFILRTPPFVGTGRAIRLVLADNGAAVAVPVKSCNVDLCIAYQQVGPRLRAAIEKGSVAEISYTVGSPRRSVTFHAPFSELASALAVI